MTDVTVPDYPIEDELTVETARSVVLVVDMQNDFAHPDGALYNPEAERTIPVIAELTERACRADVPVWYTQDTHHEGDPEWEIWGRHAEAGTFGWEIVEELRPRSDDRIFTKSRYDAFYGTGLDHALRTEERDTLVLCGTVANVCVHYTAASAGLRFLDVVHPVEAISALTAFDRHATFRQASWLFAARLVRVTGLRFGPRA